MVRLGTPAGSDDANGIHEQVRPGRGHASPFRSCHGMAANEVAAGPPDDRLKIADNDFLYAANIGDQRATLQTRRYLFGQRTHLRYRRAQDNQVRAIDSPRKVEGYLVRNTGLLTLRDTGLASNESGDSASEPALFQGESK